MTAPMKCSITGILASRALTKSLESTWSNLGSTPMAQNQIDDFNLVVLADWAEPQSLV